MFSAYYIKKALTNITMHFLMKFIYEISIFTLNN